MGNKIQEFINFFVTTKKNLQEKSKKKKTKTQRQNMFEIVTSDNSRTRNIEKKQQAIVAVENHRKKNRKPKIEKQSEERKTKTDQIKSKLNQWTKKKVKIKFSKIFFSIRNEIFQWNLMEKTEKPNKIKDNLNLWDREKI